jgi:dihydrofolate reductase
MSPRISLIAAVARNNVIGADQDIPWRIPSDFAWFKRQTMGKPMIMGRKQFETFPKPLPGRPHIVVTRSTDYAAEGVHVVHTIDDAVKLAERLAAEAQVDEIMVIGGGNLRPALHLPCRSRAGGRCGVSSDRSFSVAPCGNPRCHAIG